MRLTTARRFLGLVVMGAPLAAQVPDPASTLGFEPGTDRRLVEWPVLTDYFRTLGEHSDRIRYRELGRTTLGAPFVALVVSSPTNLRALERYRQINARLADPRRIASPAEEAALLRDGRTIVLITSSVHSTEVGGHLAPVVLAYRLATDTSARVQAILEQTIVLLVPSLNPDGVTLVARWYQRTLGTVAEGTDPPELYHHYVGHDNNRDWYAFTQIETQHTVDSLHNVWHPQIVHDIHQQGAFGSRMFVPPFLDPIEPNVDPLIVQGVNALGMHMAWELTSEGRRGVVVNASYDAWTPARAYQHYHGGVRILSETASAHLATPIDVTLEQLETSQRGFDPRLASWNFPSPWPGGRWTLHHIIDYQVAGAMSLLDHAARERQTWLANFLAIGQRAVRGWAGWPYAVVIPTEQRNGAGVAQLLHVLHRGGVEVRRALAPFEASGRSFAAGSRVVVLRQPYAAFAKALLERQSYPDLRLFPGGPPRAPYDVTAHTLPLLMDVEVATVPESIPVELTRPVPPPPLAHGYPPITARGARRVALYRSYTASMDEGWTRWVLDTWRVPYASAVDSVIRAGKLNTVFDVIILPTLSSREAREGLPATRYPAAYAGGLGDEGVAALRDFVDGGGTLISFGESSRFVIEALNLPIRDVSQGLPSERFYAPGSILRLELDAGHPLSRGMPPRTIAWYENGPLFEVPLGSSVRVVGRYPAAPDSVLLSGWILGPEHAAGRAGLVDVPQGRGRAILFGFRPQYRGQSLATYPLFLNALVR